MGQQTKIDRPWQRLYIDLLGPYPRSSRGHTTLLVVLDHFTKFILLKPLRQATTKPIIHYLKDDVFMIFGVPESVMTDNGSQFVSKDFNAFLKSQSVHHSFTASYSPQANASERVNRSILAAIRAYLPNEHRKWDEHLGEIGCALRSTVHSATGHAPYLLNFGYHMATHGSVYSLLKRMNALTEGDLRPLKRSDKLQVLHDEVRRQLELAHRKYASQYNLRARERSFHCGQEVFRRNFVLSNSAEGFNAKLAPKFVKCRITSKVGSSIYKVEDMQGRPLGNYHAKDLRT